MDNYWFLYNTSDGSIYGAPYKGGATEWTNIPEGCEVIGFMDDKVTDMVKDAFKKPLKYKVINNELTLDSGYVDVTETLDYFKQIKINELQQDYNNALVQGFSSDANGTKVYFAYGASDQTKFMKILMSMSAGLLTYPVTLYAKDSTAVQYAVEQLPQLFKDLATFEQGIEDKLHVYINQVNSATTIDEINTIIWLR